MQFSRFSGESSFSKDNSPEFLFKSFSHLVYVFWQIQLGPFRVYLLIQRLSSDIVSFSLVVSLYFISIKLISFHISQIQHMVISISFHFKNDLVSATIYILQYAYVSCQQGQLGIHYGPRCHVHVLGISWGVKKFSIRALSIRVLRCLNSRTKYSPFHRCEVHHM